MKQAMSPEEIKAQKPYLDWSLSEAEYNYTLKNIKMRKKKPKSSGI